MAAGHASRSPNSLEPKKCSSDGQASFEVASRGLDLVDGLLLHRMSPSARTRNVIVVALTKDAGLDAG